MSGLQFWVQRDERICKIRCMEIQEVLSESWPATKKFQEIFGLMDTFADEDSDVRLLDGIKIPASGPVFIPEQVAGGGGAAADSLGAGAGATSAACVSELTLASPPSAAPVLVAPLPGKDPDRQWVLEMIAKKKKEALERRDAMRANPVVKEAPPTRPWSDNWNVRWSD